MNDHDDLIRLGERVEQQAKATANEIANIYHMLSNVSDAAVQAVNRQATDVKDQLTQMEQKLSLQINGKLATVTERMWWLRLICIAVIGSILSIGASVWWSGWGQPRTSPMPYQGGK